MRKKSKRISHNKFWGLVLVGLILIVICLSIYLPKVLNKVTEGTEFEDMLNLKYKLEGKYNLKDISVMRTTQSFWYNDTKDTTLDLVITAYTTPDTPNDEELFISIKEDVTKSYQYIGEYDRLVIEIIDKTNLGIFYTEKTNREIYNLRANNSTDS